MIECLANIWASTLAYMFIHQTIPFSLDLIGFWASDGHAVYAWPSEVYADSSREARRGDGESDWTGSVGV